VSGGSFERSSESQAQAAELAVERAKRVAERGGHAAIVIDSLEGLPPAVQRRVFGAARATEEAGSLTIIASIGMAWEPQRVATTRVMLDPPAAGGKAPQVAVTRSATLRADLLGA
jgi:transcription termination factor Rho